MQAQSASPKVPIPISEGGGPNRVITVEPSWRLYREWTPALLRAAEIQADAGNLVLAADLCETMFGDDRIKAVLDTRTDTLLGMPLSFEASGDGRRSPRLVKALEVEEDWYEAFPVSEQRMVHAWGIALGVGLAEIQWTDWDLNAKGSKSRTLPRIVAKSPRHLRYDWIERTWKLKVQNAGDFSVGAADEIPISPGDGKWIIYTPASINRPWVWGAYRALSRWALLKRYAIQDWGYFSEKLGQGIWTVEGTGQGLNNDQRRMIAADIQAMGRGGVSVLPNGFSLKLIESAARSYESFKAQVDCADNGYAVAVLGQNLTTHAGASGNQGAASVHGKVSLGRTKFDDESLGTCWHDQALRPYALYNYGDEDLAPWPKRDTTPTEDLKEAASVIQQVGQGISSLVNAGAPVDLRKLCEKFKIPTLEPGEEPPARPAAATGGPSSAVPNEGASEPNATQQQDDDEGAAKRAADAAGKGARDGGESDDELP
jgi:phage gp29-like protein